MLTLLTFPLPEVTSSGFAMQQIFTKFILVAPFHRGCHREQTFLKRLEIVLHKMPFLTQPGLTPPAMIGNPPQPPTHFIKGLLKQNDNKNTCHLAQTKIHSSLQIDIMNN